MIAKPKYKDELIFKDGDTDDIISVIVDTINDNNKHQTASFSKQFSPNKGGMLNLFEWVKFNIRYKEDKDGYQWVKSPARLFAEGIGDCKSFTIFIVSVLENLGLKYIVRFASYSRDKQITHVYPIAILPNGERIVLDAVWGKFNSEKQYTYKKDYSMAQIYKLSGIGCPPQYHEVNGLKAVFNKAKNWVEDKVEDVTQWFKNKTINKVAILTLYAFYPYPVKEGSDTHRKIIKGKKVYDFLLKSSPLGKSATILALRNGIKEKTGKFPEDIFKELVPNPSPSEQKTRGGAKVGCVDPASCAVLIGAIAGAVQLAFQIAKYFIERKTNQQLYKEDFAIDPNLLLGDTVFGYSGGVPDPSQNTLPRGGGNNGNNNSNNNGGGTNEDSNDKMLTYALLAAGAYYIYTK